MVLCQMSKLGCAVGCLSRDATRDVLLLLWEQKTCLHPFGFSNNNNKALPSLCDLRGGHIDRGITQQSCAE